MTSDDSVFERNRDYPLSYVLTGADREYLRNKRKSDHPDSNPEKRIQNRLEKLPDRIQDLIIDLWLLDDDSQLSGEAWSEIKKNIGDLSQHPPIEDDLINYEELHSSEFILGYRLGNALDTLQKTSDEDNNMWLLWGITIALVGEQVGKHSDEKAFISRFRDFLQERINKRTQKVTHIQKHSTDEISDIRIQQINRIRDILIKYGLDPNPGISEALFRGIDYDPTESTEAFCEELERLLEHTPIEQTNELERAIKSDLDAVHNKDIQGVSAQTVFETVRNKSIGDNLSSGSEPAKRRTIERHLDEGVDKRSLTRALRYLSDKYDGYEWPRYPIIMKSKSGWKVSPYGILLAYCKDGPHRGTLWMYEPWEFPDYPTDGWEEFVLPAINEISQVKYDYQSILKYNPHTD